ncbi:MAG TPA: zinc-ribbon domain-containing protein [Bauldia sp.]|nr:zinc-ribbon domain-containing protein [Bauldia sp.]
MTVRCPHCATIVPLADEEIGAAGRMVRCAACGTRWLARVLDEDPYARIPAVRRMTEADAAGDALVIDHVGPGFAPKPKAAARAAAAPSRRTPRWPKILAAVAGAVAAGVILRAPIMAALPHARGLPAEVAMLEFKDVKSQTVQLRGSDALLVEGTIVNHGASSVSLPAIRITLRSSSGDAVTSWLVEPAVDGLAPGGSVGFRSALAAPPPDAANVTLNLAAREGA